MIERKYLEEEYVTKKRSATQIAADLNCSDNKVTYWLNKHGIRKRSISDAVYARSNPRGDPFTFSRPKNQEEWFLYGLGMGLFWGEGNKANKHSVRLGNTDPALLNYFLLFLERIYHIDKRRLRFGLQIFTDQDKKKATAYWINELNIKREQFQKIIVTKSLKRGTYTKKSKHGVLTIYFSNTKLRDTIMRALTELQQKTLMPS